MGHVILQARTCARPAGRSLAGRHAGESAAWRLISGARRSIPSTYARGGPSWGGSARPVGPGRSAQLDRPNWAIWIPTQSRGITLFEPLREFWGTSCAQSCSVAQIETGALWQVIEIKGR